MLKFTIIGGDPLLGRNEQGVGLHEFLSVFDNRVISEFISVSDLAHHHTIATDILVIFGPSPIDPSVLTKITYSALYFAEYSDHDTPHFDLPQRFATSFEAVLAASRPKVTNYPHPIKLLPLRFNPIPGIAQLTPPQWLRPWDASFVGAPTRLKNTYCQRYDWVKECNQTRSSLRIRAGILKNSMPPPHEDIDQLEHPLLGPSLYHLLMRLSKIALCPTGNARWTYRHYEALQAGCVVVSTDIRETELLIPLPIDRMILVPDHAQLLPYIERAMLVRNDHPDWIQQNQTDMNQYLEHNQYNRNRPKVLDLFLSQFNH